MLNISNLPRGLNSLLRVRELGQGLAQLEETVKCVVDLRDQYLLNLREYVSFPQVTTPVVGSNVFANAIVPAGELWYVWYYLVLSTLAAGEAIDLAASYAPEGNPLTCPVADYAAGIATQQVRSTARVPFWAGPGSEFSFVVRSLTAAPDVFGAMIVTKLRV